jgi:hypothetical protein
MVNTLMLERPLQDRLLVNGRRRQAMQALVNRLETWLPEEEARLQRARDMHRASGDREMEWRAALYLYERLCTALAL